MLPLRLGKKMGNIVVGLNNIIIYLYYNHNTLNLTDFMIYCLLEKVKWMKWYTYSSTHIRMCISTHSYVVSASKRYGLFFSLFMYKNHILFLSWPFPNAYDMCITSVFFLFFFVVKTYHLVYCRYLYVNVNAKYTWVFFFPFNNLFAHMLSILYLNLM